MWLRSTIAFISKDHGQARQMSALSKRMRSDFSSCSSSASEEEDDLSNPSSLAIECMQGLAQKRSQQIDFELQDYIQVSGSSSSSPSSSPPTVSKKLTSSSSSSSSSLLYSPQSHVKEETENFFSRTWANIKKTRPSVLHDPSSKIRNRERTRQSLQDSQTKHSIDSDSVAFRDLPSHPRIWKQALQTENCEESFVITSFNVLASTYAHQHRSLYPHVPDVLLSWGSRKMRILQELDFASPDIICLQEVDRFRDLAEELTSRGYVGLFKLRTGAMPDGCAIFWRKARFQLLQERSFEFSMLGMRNNVAQLCVLEVKPGTINAQSSVFRMAESTHNRRLIVGNIHVLFNPKRGEIKLGQCRAFLEQVHNMSSVWQGAPIVIGGDFNSTPSSAVYKFLATSTLDLSNLDRRYLSGQAVETVDDCKLLRKASLQQEHLEESHEISLRSHVTTQIKENKLSIQNERAGEWFTSVTSTVSAKPGRDGNLENCNQSEGRSMDSSVKHTEIKLEESHFSASSDSELLVAGRCNLSITESNIQQGKYSQWATSDFTDTHSTDNKYCSLASGLSKDDVRVQEKPKWELEELRVATGKIDCTVMRHNLNLCSVYSEVPGQPNTRDAIGEPLLTTCHKDFTGTVDYIWRSDGLKTMKVLDTVPLNTFARNKGLPLKLWGSDHLPISCELAFAQEI